MRVAQATLRAAVIGCGKIGSEWGDDPLRHGDISTHAEAYVRCAGTELAAVCDPNSYKRERAAQRWSVRHSYANVNQLLDEESPDIVSVCTPAETHFAVLAELLRAKNPPAAILAEKPLAATLQQAEEIVRLAAERGVTLAVNHSRRYAANIRQLQRMLRSGDLGNLQAVGGWYTKGTFNNGSHWFDLLRFLAGEVEWVQGLKVRGEDSQDPTFDALLGLENGVLATLRAADCRNFTIFEMELLTAKARVRLAEGASRAEIFRAAPSTRYGGYTELAAAPEILEGFQDLILLAVEDLLQAVAERRPPACTGADGVAAIRIASALADSARIGERVVMGKA